MRRMREKVLFKIINIDVLSFSYQVINIIFIKKDYEGTNENNEEEGVV
jgi:hypothetical protein